MQPTQSRSHSRSGSSRSGRRHRRRSGGNLQTWLFELITATVALPRTISNAISGSAGLNHADAARTATPHSAGSGHAVPAMSAADIVARAQALPQPGQAAPNYALPPQPLATGGIVGLTRKNPHLGLMIACLVMGIVQITLVGLLIFMMRDAGYSSGWGDATKYYIQCEKSAQLQQYGQ